jgi:hypothetical protein
MNNGLWQTATPPFSTGVVSRYQSYSASQSSLNGDTLRNLYTIYFKKHNLTDLTSLRKDSRRSCPRLVNPYSTPDSLNICLGLAWYKWGAITIQKKIEIAVKLHDVNRSDRVETSAFDQSPALIQISRSLMARGFSSPRQFGRQ